MSDAIVVHAASTPAVPPSPAVAAISALGLMQQAIEKGLDVTALSQLVDLHERMEKRAAEKEFAAQLVAFKQECPSVYRNRTAKIATEKGQGFQYTYADLHEIQTTVDTVLPNYGFSYGFDTKATATMLEVTCTLRHSNGHSASSSFTLPTENKSAATPQQKYGGARNYAKRITLIDVLGLQLAEEDESAAAAPARTKISQDQYEELKALVTELGTDLNRGKFDAHFGIRYLEDLTTDQHSEACRILEDLRRKKGAAR